MKFLRPVFLLACCLVMLTGCGLLLKINAESAIDAMNKGDVDTYYFARPDPYFVLQDLIII